jgi:membrane protease YdiL (CAAX protease family)
MSDFQDEYDEDMLFPRVAPPPVQPEITEEEAADETPQKGYRGGTGDPAFGFLLALALSIGLTPMLPENADLRYTLAWSALAGVSVLGWLLGSAERIGQEQPEDLAWGIGFGLLGGVLFLLFGNNILREASHLIFPATSVGTLLAYLIFVMPLAETLFFRGILQQNLEFYIVGVLAGVWNIILFFPVMWGAVLQAPAVAVVIAIALLTMNLLYSYVRDRNGLAAAWLCQIVGVLLTMFVPFL